MVGSVPFLGARSQPAPGEAAKSLSQPFVASWNGYRKMSCSASSSDSSTLPFLYKPPPTAIPADGPCPSLLVRRAPILQHPVLLTLGNGHKWRKDLNPPSQQKILLSAKWPKNLKPWGFVQTLLCYYFLLWKWGIKGKTPHFPRLDLSGLQEWRKRWKNFSRQLYICSSHLELSSVLQQQPVTFPAQQQGWGQAGFLQFIQESTDLAVTNQEQLCPRDTILPPMRIFQMRSLLKDEKRQTPGPEHFLSHWEESQIMEPEDILEIKLFVSKIPGFWEITYFASLLYPRCRSVRHRGFCALQNWQQHSQSWVWYTVPLPTPRSPA